MVNTKTFATFAHDCMNSMYIYSIDTRVVCVRAVRACMLYEFGATMLTNGVHCHLSNWNDGNTNNQAQTSQNIQPLRLYCFLLL